jgi:predicted AAA+ superfamily ATPase
MSILREITLQAQKHLQDQEVAIFIGARQAGKTTVLKQIQSYLIHQEEGAHFLNLEDPDYLKLLNESPKNLFKIFPFDFQKRTYVFIDEIQYLRDPSNFLKFFYDEYKDKIKLLVSGSSAFYLDEKFKDSLAGRKKIFHVRTVSFREFLRFKNEDELSARDFKILTISDLEKINRYFEEYAIYGGYPRVVLAPLEEKKDILQEIAHSYIKKDIFEAGVRQDEVFYQLFKILAAQVGALVNSSELSSTLGASKTAIDHYLYLMQKSFHVRLIRPFFQNVRKELTKMPKVYFYDLGLRNFFFNNFNQLVAREDKGALLENIVFRQLLEKQEEGEIKFWRTVSKNEIDFIVRDKLAMEVKADARQFKKSKYKTFFGYYPGIPINIVSWNGEKNNDSFPILRPWEI